MNKTKKRIISLLLCFVLGCTTVFAAGDSFDSSVDPLVSLSYINEILVPDLENQIKEARIIAESNSEKASKEDLERVADNINNLEEKLKVLEATVKAIQKSLEDDAEKPLSAAYSIVYLKYGQKIFSQRYSFEVILRTGEAEVISSYSYEQGSEYAQGVADITAGVDIQNGGAISKNHLLVVPSGGDGRGILVTSEDAYLLVRGEYYIVN